MIYSLRGILLCAAPGYAVVECGGVGYRCTISLTTLSQLPPTGNEVMLYTYMVVRDDAVDLYGFADERELDCFRMLTSVNGVGARLALGLLSDLLPDKLALAIAAGDTKMLMQTSGIGNKTAQRMVLELKDKLSAFGASSETMETLTHAVGMSDGGAQSEAAAALITLGYSPSEAAVALAPCPKDMSVEQMIKAGLKQLSKRTYE